MLCIKEQFSLQSKRCKLKPEFRTFPYWKHRRAKLVVYIKWIHFQLGVTEQHNQLKVNVVRTKVIATFDTKSESSPKPAFKGGS